MCAIKVKELQACKQEHNLCDRRRNEKERERVRSLGQYFTLRKKNHKVLMYTHMV